MFNNQLSKTFNGDDCIDYKVLQNMIFFICTAIYQKYISAARPIVCIRKYPIASPSDCVLNLTKINFLLSGDEKFYCFFF